MLALRLLHERPDARQRVLLFIGQPADRGSESHLEDLRLRAERENVTVHALVLPQVGTAFLSDTFSLRGLSSANIRERGGFRADVKLSKLIPVLARTAAVADGADPFSVLAAATGGTQLHFRTQNQLEDAIALIGVQLRSLYTLSFRPGEGGDGAPGYHAIRVETTIPGTTVHARPGYWLGKQD